MKLNIANEISQELYPLAWFIADWTGAGKMGGNFGVAELEFTSEVQWEAVDNQLLYKMMLSTNNQVVVQEVGMWEVLNSQPEKLRNQNQFTISAQITTSLSNSQELRTKELMSSWRTNYVGIVGFGRAELLSDKIELLDVNCSIGNYFVNDLWRSKRMFGLVNSQLMWAWDIALVGTQNQLLSLASGTLR